MCSWYGQCAVRILANDGSETEQLLGEGALELRARTGRSEPRCRVGGALLQLQGGAGARGRRQVSAGCGSPRLAFSRASELGAKRSKPRTTGLLTRVGDNDVLTYKSLQDSTALATYISTLGAYAITIICVIEHVWSLCIICVSNCLIGCMQHKLRL